MYSIGSNLRNVRLLRNLSLEEASDLLNMSSFDLDKYEEGFIIPDSSKLIEFANIYDVKVLYLLEGFDKAIG